MQRMETTRRLKYFSGSMGDEIHEVGFFTYKTSVLTDGEIHRVQVRGKRKHREMVKVRFGDLSYFVLAVDAQESLRPVVSGMVIST